MLKIVSTKKQNNICKVGSDEEIHKNHSFNCSTVVGFKAQCVTVGMERPAVKITHVIYQLHDKIIGGPGTLHAVTGWLVLMAKRVAMTGWLAVALLPHIPTPS